MKRIGLLAVAVILLLPHLAFALATEYFGNAPLQPGQMGLTVDATEVMNLPTRVYCYEVNGSPGFFYRGDVRDVNVAIEKFAKLKIEHKQIRLLVGPGETKNLQQTKTIACDWSIHTRGGFDRPTTQNPAVMTIYITVPKSNVKIDEKAIQKAIDELSSAMFSVRDEATKQLRAVGFAGVPYFQAALKATDSLEARSRLEELLARLKGIDLQRLELPKVIPVFGPESLSRYYREQMKESDTRIRGRAVYSWVQHEANRKDVVKLLGEFLETEKNEYVLRSASSAIESLGSDAKPLLPQLRKLISSPDGNVATAYAEVVKKIEKSNPSAAQPDASQETARLRADIDTTVAEHIQSQKK